MQLLPGLDKSEFFFLIFIKQIHNENSNSFFSMKENNLIFQIFDLDKYKMLLRNQLLIEKMGLLSIIKKIPQQDYCKDENDTKAPTICLNLSLLRRFDEPVVKLKEPFFTDIFKVFDLFISEFCSGEKLIIPKENYDDFLNESLQSHFMTGNRFTFEYDLNFVVSLVFTLFENNILIFYYKLFITSVKPKYETIEEADLKEKDEKLSLFERIKFNKLSLNVTKHMKLKSYMTTERKETDILKEKEDFVVQRLFESMQKNKINKEIIKESPLIHQEIPSQVLFATNPCELINVLGGNNFNYFYQNFHNEEEKTLPNEVKYKNNRQSSKNGHNNSKIYSSRNGYDKRKKTEICFVPKQSPTPVETQTVL